MRVTHSVLILLPAVAIAGLACSMRCVAQLQSRPQPNPAGPSIQSSADEGSSDQPEQELQKGTAQTRQGLFHDAIPHLKAAQGRVANEYAASFNLSLCFVGTHQYTLAIEILNDLRRGGHDSSDVENLLAQAYVGNGQASEAFAALEKAASLTPQNEKLYLLVSDACAEHQDFALGLRVVDLGLSKLPLSARLHYQRAVLLSQFDQFDRAKPDFELASQSGQGTDIGYLASAHAALLGGDVANAVRIARDGVNRGSDNPTLLTILGEALLRSGVAPGEPGFTEAQASLEKAVSARPNDASAQIALGQIYLLSGRVDDAISRLERAQQMQPNQPAVYASLAKAYQRRGDSQRSEHALATLEKLNRVRAERIRSAPGDRKMSYSGGEVSGEQPPRHP